MVWVAGHFGEWIQGLVAGQLALVTLACPVRGVRLTRRPAERFTLDDPAGLLFAERATALLRAAGARGSGFVRVAADVPPGGGAGMSTASLVALARLFDVPEDKIAALCLTVEGAVDPLMLPAPDAVLWAPRQARMLSPLPAPPAAQIVGGFWGPPQQTEPEDQAFPRVDDLVAAWREGPALEAAAQLASASAERTTAMRGPDGDPTAELARQLGALGWARAHTGSARALIFAPQAEASGAEAALRTAGFEHVLGFTTGGRT